MTSNEKKWDINEEIQKELDANPFARKFEKVEPKGKTTIIGFPEPVDTEPLVRPRIREDISGSPGQDFTQNGIISTTRPESKHALTGQVNQLGVTAIHHPKEHIDSNYDEVTDDELAKQREERELRAGFEDANLPRREASPYNHPGTQGGFNASDVVAEITHSQEWREDTVPRQPYSIDGVSPTNFGSKIKQVRKQ